jgi:REP element-mobilizing transposase RayT
MKQLAFKLRTWGGKRRRAGRKPKGAQAGVPHLARERFPARHPVHVTLRALRTAGYLRRWTVFKAIRNAIREAQERFGLRVIHFSVQGNHLHLLVEADGAQSLSRGMQGLTIRIARAINGASNRRGKVFPDRYHAHVLGSRREVAEVLRYILQNFRHHLRPDVAPSSIDPCSSAASVVGPASPGRARRRPANMASAERTLQRGDLQRTVADALGRADSGQPLGRG